MGLLDIVGGALGTNHTDDAIAAQQAGANNANGTQKYIYDQTRADNQPWRDAGVDALQKMQNPDFQKSFTLSDFHEDPGYQFALNEGQKALERSAAAKGMQMSGGQLKAITNYGQGMADQQYQSAYDRFNNDQSTRFNRLASLAGIGQTANAANQSAGMNYGNNVSQTQMGLGNAMGAAEIARGNQNSQLLQQGITAGFLFCDERLKCDIRAVSKEDMAELRANIKPYFFKYKKPEKHGQGEYLGVMTKDLKKSKLGSALVTMDEEGNECIDLHRLLMLFLASQAEG